jgi:hypothetical protein
MCLLDRGETQGSDDDDDDDGMFFDGLKDSRNSGVVVTDNKGTSMSMGMDGTIGASGSLGGLTCGDI